ncbi:MAG: YezD family protein [Ruminiclostridium sp.]
MAAIKWLNNEESKSISDEELNKLIKLIDSIQFGSVTITIKDGKVVQFEKNVKLRLK